MNAIKTPKSLLSVTSAAVISAAFLFLPGKLAANWLTTGPGPAVNAQDEGITSPEGDNPVAGAIEAVAPSATNANIIYVATVNGGVWKTTNAKAASPTWTALTDSALPSGSLASIAISPLDPNVIFVGSGHTSSLGNNGGKQFGVARSSDGGTTWKVVGTNLQDQNVRSIVPTKELEAGKQVVLAGTLSGVYRSVDGGTTYTQVLNGIQANVISDLVRDPSSPTRFYAASGGIVYRSDDTGGSWTDITGNGLTVIPTSRVLLSVHNSTNNDVLYAAVIDGGSLSNVYRSPDQGANWTALGVPSPVIFPGMQGDFQGAIVADKTDPNIVWVSGDRQPDNTEINNGTNQFPNPNGANNYSANIFRNVSGAWELAVLNGANGSSPHADSRSMAFDADGNLLQTCDGGIYKLTDPSLTSRIWSSLNGNMRITEAHTATYDALAKVFMSGAQDNGVSIQPAPGNFVWLQAAQGDGGRVDQESDQKTHAGTSIRYFCAQKFGGFTRQSYDATGAVVDDTPVGLMITAGAGKGQVLGKFDKNIDFTQPYAINQIDATRMLIATQNIYESLDRGDTLTNLGPAVTPAAQVGDTINSGSSPIAYGSRLNGAAFPSVFYVGAGSSIAHRVTAGGAITTLTSYPGDVIRGIVIDPQNYKRVFVLDAFGNVYGSFNEGATWSNLTANLPQLNSDIRSIELFNPDAGFTKSLLFAGGAGGVYKMAKPSATGTWSVVSPGMPKVLVYDLRYNYTDNTLSAATLGRGVLKLAGATPAGLVGNVSTRLPVGTGDNVLIEGFIVQGPAGSTKKILVRAIGQSLKSFGITDALANPSLEIHDSKGAIVATNNDWKKTQIGGLITSSQVAAIQASQLEPTNDLESTVIVDLAPGQYTAIVSGVGNTIGTGLVDAYDISADSPAHLANISTRGLIQPGDKLMIAGFIIQNAAVKTVVRAIGPSLTSSGIQNALADTTLELHNSNGAIVLANDNWKDTQKAELEATTLQPKNDLEAAIVLTIQPGAYTAQVRGKNNASGIGDVEVYFLQ